MKYIFPFLFLLVFIPACASAPSESVIQTAIAQTQAAVPPVTLTPAPTTEPTPAPSPCISEATHAQLSDILARFDDAVTLADSTPRIQLAEVIAEMQAIRREAGSLEVSECLGAIYPTLVTSMDAIIEGFTAFMAQKDYLDGLAQGFTTRAEFDTAYNRLRVQDGLSLGTLEPAPLEALAIAPEPDRILTVITLTNMAAYPLKYVSGAVVHRNADGTSTSLESVFYLTLDPGETVTVEFSRTKPMIDQGITYEGITVEISEMYLETE